MTKSRNIGWQVFVNDTNVGNEDLERLVNERLCGRELRTLKDEDFEHD